MSSTPRNPWSAASVLVVLALGACSSSARSAPTNAAATTAATSTTLAPGMARELREVRSLTALGDSVPAGTACNCTPYPQLTATDIEQAAGHTVVMTNDAVPGYQSRDVLAQLDDDPIVIQDVEQSDAITVEIGANDVGFTAACAMNAACYGQQLPALRQNLHAIVARIQQLTAGHTVVIMLLDYWNVWLGGKYARQQGPAYVDAATNVTTNVNGAIRATATSSGSIFVDLSTAFRGPDNAWDETHLLAADGDHPNAAGHRRIASAIEDTVAAHA